MCVCVSFGACVYRSLDIGWVHIEVGRLNDVCGMCIGGCGMPHSVCTTVYIHSSHTFLLSQTGSHNWAWKIREIIFHKSLRHIVLLLRSKH